MCELSACFSERGAWAARYTRAPDERRRHLLSTAAPPVERAPAAAGAARTTEDRSGDDLAARIAAGDARAFERLYALHRAEISRYCATLVRNPQDAEEAFQLTMLAAYRALSTGRGPRGALRPWLFRIAHNECVDLLRGRPPVEELTERQDPVAGLLHERVEARETLRQLNDDIAALPLRQRAAFVLHEIDGLPHAAVGEALGTTDLGARQLLHEARTTLEEFHAGRALACDDVRVRIGAGDRRILRGRGISAHLRGCASCRDARADAQTLRARRRRLLVAAATAAIVAGMVALGVRSLAAAPAAGERPTVPVAASPAPLTAPSLGTAPVVAAPAPPAAPVPAAKAAAGTQAPAADPLPAPPLAPDPEVVIVQDAPDPVVAAPPPAVVPVAPPAAADPVTTIDPATGEPSALAVAPSEDAAPPPTHKPDTPAPGQPAEPSAPVPAPTPPGEVVPQEETPAPEPGAPELAPAPSADAPATTAEASASSD
ncbi:MAG: sigma-70 family RNA polymerase sigma factor [Thermoleophilia bacterium]